MEDKNIEGKTSTQLIIYRLDELKSDIKSLSSEVKKIGTNGCFYGQTNLSNINLLKDDIIILKKRPRETIIFTGICLALVLTICSIFLYLHNTLPLKNPTLPTRIVKSIGL